MLPGPGRARPPTWKSGPARRRGSRTRSRRSLVAAGSPSPRDPGLRQIRIRDRRRDRGLQGDVSSRPRDPPILMWTRDRRPPPLAGGVTELDAFPAGQQFIPLAATGWSDPTPLQPSSELGQARRLRPLPIRLRVILLNRNPASKHESGLTCRLSADRRTPPAPSPAPLK